MTIDPRLERILPAVLAELGGGPAPDYTDLLLERIGRVRQRPAWVFRERWLPAFVTPDRRPFQGVRWRTIVAVALLIIALLAAAILTGVGRLPRLPAPFGPAFNGAIVYESNGDIYDGDPTTGVSHPIISGPTFDFRPGYSPDGTTLAFLRHVDPARPGATDIVVARADGSAARIITATPLANSPAYWAWAPDSRSITLLTANGPNGLFEVFDTTAVNAPHTIHPEVAIDPPWAFQPPEGRQILFRGHTGSQVGLYTMDLDGGHLTPIVKPFLSPKDQIDLGFPAWSPDGSQIAVQRVARVDWSMGLYLMNADGTGSREIGYSPGDVSDGWPSWSPDGTRIAFQRARGDANGSGDLVYSYAVVNIVDGTLVTTYPSLAFDTLATWSPDGSEILVLNRTAGHPELILDPAGANARIVPWPVVGGDWQRVGP